MAGGLGFEPRLTESELDNPYCFDWRIYLHVAFVSRLAQKRPFGRSKFSAIVTAGEQMAVHIGRHLDTRMPEAVLHDLEGQPQTAILFAVDAPRRIEVPQRVQAGVFGLPALCHHAC